MPTSDCAERSGVAPATVFITYYLPTLGFRSRSPTRARRASSRMPEQEPCLALAAARLDSRRALWRERRSSVPRARPAVVRAGATPPQLRAERAAAHGAIACDTRAMTTLDA